MRLCANSGVHANGSAVLRVCRRSLVAIPDHGNPLVSDILLLCNHAPSLMTALLALAAQVRSYQATGNPTALLDPYHNALSEFQQDLSHPNTDTMAAVAGALVLVVLSTAGPGNDWQHHAAHAIHLLDCTDVEAAKLSRTGLFLVMLAAHYDMTAFTLGRPIAPISAAWSRWQLQGTSSSLDDEFLPHEIVTGYPAALISLISELDICASHLCSSSHPMNGPAPNNEHLSEWARLRHKLEAWRPRCLPEHMLDVHKSSRRIARKCMHYAAILYHNRIFGFRANLLNPLPNGMATANMVEDILINIKQLLQHYSVDAIPTGNAMAWPLAVAGSECGSPVTRYLQADVLSLIEDMAASFSMSHLRPLGTVFRTLWLRYERYETSSTSNYLSLEIVAQEHDLTILLL
jgi:hypothetical protein